MVTTTTNVLPSYLSSRVQHIEYQGKHYLFLMELFLAWRSTVGSNTLTPTIQRYQGRDASTHEVDPMHDTGHLSVLSNLRKVRLSLFAP
jgi:hypothetical protein